MNIRTLYRYERGLKPEYLQDAQVYLKEYKIIRETPKCFVIKKYSSGSDETFVLKDAKKRFAYPTIKEALSGFIAKTKSAIKHQENALMYSKAFLSAAQNINTSTDKVHKNTLI